MKRKPLAACLAALALLLSGCGAAAPGGSTPGTDAPAAKLQIITTIFPQYDFVREIAGDLVDVSLLITPGAESHSFEPTPRDMIALQESDVFIYVGGESDAWVERVIESLEMDDTTLLTLAAMVDTVEEELVEGMTAGHSHDGDDHDDHDHDEDEAHDHEDDHDHEDGPELDEHVWTSPKNAIKIVEAITETLCALDAGNAATYRANADAYTAQLQALDEDFTALVAGAARTTLLFGDRFPFRYFADAYGLTYYAAFPGCSSDSEASAATMAFLIDKVEEENIPVVFTIEFSTGKIADTICEATGAEKRQLHSVHNVTRDELESGEGYLSLMRRNLETLKEALT